MMQVVRTVIWVLLLVGLLLFSIANWDPTVTVRIWDGIVVDTKIPAIVITSFLIGFVPMWLYHRGSKWRANRKIASLEHAARTAATTPVAAVGATDDGEEAMDARADPATPLRPAEPVEGRAHHPDTPEAEAAEPATPADPAAIEPSLDDTPRQSDMKDGNTDRGSLL